MSKWSNESRRRSATDVAVAGPSNSSGQTQRSLAVSGEGQALAEGDGREAEQLRAEKERANKRARELAELDPRVPFDPHIFACECTSCIHCQFHERPCGSCEPGEAYCPACTCDGCYHRQRCKQFLKDGCGRGCRVCDGELTHSCKPCRAKFPNVLQWCYHSQNMHPAEYILLWQRMQKLHKDSVLVHRWNAGGRPRNFYYVRPFYYDAGNVARHVKNLNKFNPETDPQILNQLQAETSWLNFIKMNSSDVKTAESFLQHNGDLVSC